MIALSPRKSWISNAPSAWNLSFILHRTRPTSRSLFYSSLRRHSSAQFSNALSADCLRSLLRSIGGPTSGTKSILLPNLTTALQYQRLPTTVPNPTIVSIDMGLRNLGVCVAEVQFHHRDRLLTATTGEDRAGGKKEIKKSKLQPASSCPASTSSQNDVDVTLTVSDWRRIELLTSTPSSLSEFLPPPSSPGYLPTDRFAPTQLAALAHTVVEQLVAPHRPTAVLIERQRWRTGGGAAVQQWTVRVGLLEMGLWTALTGLERGATDKAGMEVIGVSPARVAAYWLTKGGQKEKGTDSKGKREKREKIGLVTKWLREGAEGSGMRLAFKGQAESMAQAFVEKVERVRTRSAKSRADAAGIGKVDDLSDCLLQAAAFAKWEANKRLMEGMTDEELKT